MTKCNYCGTWVIKKCKGEEFRNCPNLINKGKVGLHTTIPRLEDEKPQLKRIEK